MNDFFSVLDEFEFEEFVAPSDDTDSGFVNNTDTTGDSSATYQDEEAENILDAKTEVTKTDGSEYVWKNGNPLTGNNTGVWLGFVATKVTVKEDGGADGNLTYKEIEVNSVAGFSFTEAVSDDKPFQIDQGSVNFAFGGSSGLNVALSNGIATQAHLSSGNGHFMIWSGYSAGDNDSYTSENGKITADLSGFGSESVLNLDENGYIVTLESIDTDESAGGIVAVNGDYKFTLDDNSIQIKNVRAAAGEFTLTYGSDGKLAMDLSELAAEDGAVIQVKAADDVTLIAPPTTDNADTDATVESGSIKIGTTTYKYAADEGDNDEKAYFITNGTTVAGFVLVNTGDAITVTDSNFKVYDDDEVLAGSEIITGSNYTVTKTKYGYVAEVTAASASLTIGDTQFDFAISKGTRATFTDENGNVKKGIKIYFNEDGNVEGVQNLDLFTSDKDTMTVTAPNVTDEEGGIPIIKAGYNVPATGLITSAAVNGYVSVNTGDFTYNGKADANANAYPQVHVADEAQVFTVDGVNGGIAGVYVDNGNGGTVTDGEGDEFEYSGKGYLVQEGDNIVRFVFTAKGDQITVPTDEDDRIGLRYNGNDIAVPTVTDEDGYVTVALTDADTSQFTLGALGADAVVSDDNIEFNFEQEGGTAKFSNTTNGDVTIDGVYGFVGSADIDENDSGIIINGNVLTVNYADDDQVAKATSTTGTALDTVTGLKSGDVVNSYVEGTTTDAETVFEFTTTGGTDTFTVNGRTYTVEDDNDGELTISADGEVGDLDEDAILTVDGFAKGETLTVNDVEYDGYKIAEEDIEVVGFQTRSKARSSYDNDPDHPIFNNNTDRDFILNTLGVNDRSANYVESTDGSQDLSSVSGTAQYTFDDTEDNSVIFNDEGGNVAIVSAAAKGDKTILLGDKGDAVIMDGRDENGSVSITTGAGNDTIVIRGETREDAIYRESAMTTTIDMASNGIDKIITYAAANANIVLENYDVINSKSGIVIHDPELPYIKEDIEDAIKDGLLVFDNGSIFAIDRGEADGTGTLPEGTDRKTQITVNNVSGTPGTMVRLFGYKDRGGDDDYGDDFGQLVGFADVDGGTFDASAIAEEVVLVGNYDGNKAASSLITGLYDDTVFAGAGDTIDTGDGVDTVILDDTAGREAATIIVGRGAGDAVENLHSGFEGDIFDVTSYDGKLDYTFTDGVLGIVDTSSKSSLLAETDEDGEFVKQRFINGSEVLYAAIAEEGGTIEVTDNDDIVPNYYLAKDGAIDFSNYSGYVGIDVDGEDLDYPSAVGSTDVSIGSAVNTLIGGSGTTIFKGGKGNETLIAGIGESSLYGGGGKNVLIGLPSGVNEDKVGSTEFFNIGIHNGAQNTIVGFEFIEQGATNQATFDNLNLGMADGNEVTDLKVVNGAVAIAVKGQETGATEKVSIVGAAGEEMLVDRGTETETVAQIAASEVTVNNSYVDFYAATEKNATVKIGESITSAKVWLEAPDYSDGVEFVGDFSVIDATGSTANVEMAGNNVANTIIGGNGNASMWGGAGNANDLMVAGYVHNEFYYEMGNGNDTILGGLDGDIIHLGATLDQIDFDGTVIESGAINVSFKDGGSLNIQNSAEVTFSFDDGTTIKANRQTQQFE